MGSASGELLLIPLPQCPLCSKYCGGEVQVLVCPQISLRTPIRVAQAVANVDLVHAAIVSLGAVGEFGLPKHEKYILARTAKDKLELPRSAGVMTRANVSPFHLPHKEEDTIVCYISDVLLFEIKQMVFASRDVFVEVGTCPGDRDEQGAPTLSNHVLGHADLRINGNSKEIVGLSRR